MVDTRQNGAAPTALLYALEHGPMSRDQIKAQLGLDWRQTTNAARNLGRRGYLQVAKDGTYQLSDAGKVAVAEGVAVRSGPRGKVKIVPDTFRQRAWTAIRLRNVFTIGDIVMDATKTAGEGQPEDNAARYLSRLKQAGFIAETAHRRPGTAPSSNGFKQFTLRKNTGPLAPVFRADEGVMFDPNTGKNIQCKA